MKIPRNQKGLAVLVLVFMLALVAIGYAVNALESSDIQNEKNKKTAAALAEAKAALIGWSVSHQVQPGVLPFPDRGTDGNYDGNSDCVGGTPGFNLLIGRLPFLGQTAPCAAPVNGLATSLTDGNGEQLWYAVSRNLIRTSIVPSINPSILNATNWLIVKDKDGVPISSRVAAVIIAPGNPIGTQNRAGIASVENYLDTLGAFSNSNYDSATEDFFMIREDGSFNDQLVFITIDELMDAVEKRVAKEVILSLNNYYAESAPLPNDRFYPYAADISFNCIDGLLAGALPIGAACATSPLTGLPTWFFQNGWESFFYYAISPDCSINGPNQGCASGVITVGEQTNINAIIVTTGPELAQTELGLSSLQTRPSNSVEDYLDSIENTDGDNIYDAVSKQKTNVYNDQVFIMSP